MSGAFHNDVLMFFRLAAGGKPIAADSTIALGGDTKLMTGFEAGCFFGAEDFGFGIKLFDDEAGENVRGDTRSFARWRGLTDTKLKPQPPFAADPDHVTVERMVDSSSPLLMQHCLDSTPFHSAALVKRTRSDGNPDPRVVLRLDFTRIWILDLKWTDGDTVRESCTFKFSAVTMTYAGRKLDNTARPDAACSWSVT